MGVPKFQRKKYDTPSHPWKGDRIQHDKEIVKKFGLGNKREIWKAQTRLREMRGQARQLVSRIRNPSDAQGAREADLLLARLYRQGYTGEGASLNDVLGLDLERILNRRLQSQVYLKGLARSMKQARQFVVHGHIRIADRVVDVPSYIVRREEEDLLSFHPASPVADDDHPVRPKPEGWELLQESQPVAQTEEVEAPAAEETTTEEATA